MMMALLVFKTKCKDFFDKHYTVVRGILKIIVSAIVFAVMLSDFPFHPILQQYKLPLVMIVAPICGFIPDLAVMCLVALMMTIDISAVSIVVAFGFFAVLAIYFLLFGRYTKSQSYLVLLIPLLGAFEISYSVPIIAALFLTPAMIPACVVGVFVQYLLVAIREYYIVSQTAVDTGNTMEGLQYIFSYVMTNKEMLIYMVTYALAFSLVYIIRKRKFNYASHIAILVGVLTCMAGVILGDSIWSVQADVARLFWGLAISAVIAYVVQFFRMSLDYMGVRNLQFEDDEYFYYVKAVPKMKVTVSEKTVTKIEEDINSDID
nr:hypothetical protein [Eubacterium sp.]